MINSPLWSTLMLELDARRSIIGHDQRVHAPLLTSAEANGGVRLIT
jgi:hypothetical protein